jgi:hypothetical protein
MLWKRVNKKKRPSKNKNKYMKFRDYAGALYNFLLVLPSIFFYYFGMVEESSAEEEAYKTTELIMKNYNDNLYKSESEHRSDFDKAMDLLVDIRERGKKVDQDELSALYHTRKKHETIRNLRG